MSDTVCCSVTGDAALDGTLEGWDVRFAPSAGAPYHLTGHSVAELAIFADDLDRQDFVVRLGRAIVAARWDVFIACLLPNHYHLVFRPTVGRASDAVQTLHGGFARAFNQRHARRGAVWEARFRTKQIEDEEHLLAAVRYVALNPVRARLVGQPEDWPWSTYGQAVGLRPPWPSINPRLALQLFGDGDSLRAHVDGRLSGV